MQKITKEIKAINIANKKEDDILKNRIDKYLKENNLPRDHEFTDDERRNNIWNIKTSDVRIKRDEYLCWLYNKLIKKFEDITWKKLPEHFNGLLLYIRMEKENII